MNNEQMENGYLDEEMEKRVVDENGDINGNVADS